jgi:hypothetical protein
MEDLRTDVNDGIIQLRNIEQNWENAGDYSGNMYERAESALSRAYRTGSAANIATASEAAAEMDRAKARWIAAAADASAAAAAAVMTTARNFVDAARATGNNDWLQTAMSDYDEAQRQADRMDFIRNFDGSDRGQVNARGYTRLRELIGDLSPPDATAVAAAAAARAAARAAVPFRDVPRGTQNIITSNNIEEGNNMVTWGRNLLLADPRYYKKSTFESLRDGLDPFTRQAIQNETEYRAHLVGGRHKKTRKGKARDKTSRRMRRFRK